MFFRIPKELIKLAEKEENRKSLAWGLRKFYRWFKFYRRMVRKLRLS
jgi:hypothetical protein